MILNKRGGSLGSVIGAIIIFGVVLAILTSYLVGIGEGGEFVSTIENLPLGLEKVFEIYANVLGPVFNGIFSLVAGSGATLDSNEGMIALGIFFLLVIIGTSTLNKFFRSQTISFVVSAIVGIIASRGLMRNPAIIDEVALAGSPIAATTFLLGILPVLMVQSMLDKWFAPDVFDRNAQTAGFMIKRVTFWIVLAAVYYFVFRYVFNAQGLGIIYAAGIVLFAIGDAFLPELRKRKEERESKRTGRFMRWWEGVWYGTQQAQRAAEEFQAP